MVARVGKVAKLVLLTGYYHIAGLRHVFKWKVRGAGTRVRQNGDVIGGRGRRPAPARSVLWSITPFQVWLRRHPAAVGPRARLHGLRDAPRRRFLRLRRRRNSSNRHEIRCQSRGTLPEARRDSRVDGPPPLPAGIARKMRRSYKVARTMASTRGDYQASAATAGRNSQVLPRRWSVMYLCCGLA